MHDVSNIWRVPLLMQSQDAHGTILGVLGLTPYRQHLDMHQWKVQIADR
jgi:CTP synthase